MVNTLVNYMEAFAQLDAEIRSLTDEIEAAAELLAEKKRFLVALETQKEGLIVAAESDILGDVIRAQKRGDYK